MLGYFIGSLDRRCRSAIQLNRRRAAAEANKSCALYADEKEGGGYQQKCGGTSLILTEEKRNDRQYGEDRSDEEGDNPLPPPERLARI
ncbi:hypothetical protein Airi02_089000 [Actinoallomurus iriomotensis]|uniref:Uncharacterized protein n=1 Tax=Actinoallomurus iriomotensis TaxID=478107 RepID=A0A9W6S9K9_9ACTN|nr:hypothetical protein Airi02_089000 [Actinoallomurus iriomotensis]